MPQIFRLIGGAGTGKTTELLRLMGLLREKGIDDPLKIGFVSFTRAARETAARRAASQFDTEPEELERHGWFRTLHSTCLKALGNPSEELLTDSKESREWMAENVSKDYKPATEGSESPLEDLKTKTPTSIALGVWDVSRAKLEPLSDTYARVRSLIGKTTDTELPSYEGVLSKVEHYEQAKQLDGRMDFTDLVARFSGVRFSPKYGPSEKMPEGEIPALPVWFFDEQQDASALLDRVCKRLISSPQVRWVYVVGDPFQSIYGFAGSDSSHFMGWPVDRERVMPKTHRCGAAVQNLGEKILSKCGDYFDRGIEPADHDAKIARASQGQFFDKFNPREEWLLLTRTQFQSRQLARKLDEKSIPWRSTLGNNTWTAPIRNKAISAMMDLQEGAPIDGGQWQAILKSIPASRNGCQFLERGTKKRFEDDSEAERYQWVMPHELTDLGATETLQESIESGDWVRLIDKAQNYVSAATRYGRETVEEIKVRVGTIHSAKGEEAENVALLNESNKIITDQAEYSKAVADEERRVAYVGVTRARSRLVILDSKRRGYPLPLS